MAKVALPNCARDGEFPLSCQEMVAGWPAVKVEESTGEVIYFNESMVTTDVGNWVEVDVQTHLPAPRQQEQGKQ